MPEQTGSALTTGPVGVIVFPQLSTTFGGVGTACALLIQATVDEPGAGNVKFDGLTVYVNTHWAEAPVQSV